MFEITGSDGVVIEIGFFHLIVLLCVGWGAIALIGLAFHHTITEALGGIRFELKRIAKVQEDKWKEWKM